MWTFRIRSLRDPINKQFIFYLLILPINIMVTVVLFNAMKPISFAVLRNKKVTYTLKSINDVQFDRINPSGCIWDSIILELWKSRSSRVKQERSFRRFLRIGEKTRASLSAKATLRTKIEFQRETRRRNARGYEFQWNSKPSWSSTDFVTAS